MPGSCRACPYGEMLFREPKYLLQLYQALHPEDLEATEDSIKNVTITNVLLDQYYNDVGFQIGEKIVILVEQQSSWSINIVVRCLLYLAQTYQEYFESTKQNVYGSLELLFTIGEERHLQGSAVFDFQKVCSKEAYTLDLSGPVGTAALREIGRAHV